MSNYIPWLNLSEEDQVNLANYINNGNKVSQADLESQFVEPQAKVVPVENKPIVQNKRIPDSVKSEEIQQQQQSVPSVDNTIKNPMVRDYLMQKLKSDFSDEKYQQAQQEMKDRQDSLALSQLGAGIGDALARKGSGASDNFFNQRRNDIKDQTVGNFENRKKSLIENASSENQIQKMQREQDQFDPNSQASQSFRKIIESNFPNVAKAYGNNWSQVSAADQDAIFRPLQLKENIEARKEQARILSQQRDDAKQVRDEEKTRGRMTIYGEARTDDDAKKIKEGSELKEKFDRQLKELVDLRKDKGVEYLDREAVARGKQLSKDLLLTYKDMAKLGVLSQSDEKILNAIIPDDPLGQDGIPGQDPILYKLESFSNDTNADFEARLKNRLQNYNKSSESKNNKFPMQVRKGNQVATVSNEQELKEAREEGFQ